MDLFDAIEKRASVRQFEKVQVPFEHLKRLVDAGRRAPSGRNVQPREFIIIDDAEALKALGALLPVLDEASAAIGIVADGASQFWLEDASAAAANILLAVTALGYASVWIEGGLARVEAEAKKVLGIPAEKRLIILLPIGKPRGPVAQKDKKPLADVTHRNRYGARLA